MSAPPPPTAPGDPRAEPAPPEGWRTRRANPRGEVLRLQLAVGLPVLAVLAGLWLWQSRRQAAFDAALDGSAAALARGDAAGLESAESILRELVARRPGNDLARARLALVLALLWHEHGVAAVAGEVRQRVAALERDSVAGPDAAAARAVVARASGRDEEALRLLDLALEAGGRPPYLVALRRRWPTSTTR
jgi:hypothetical protein